MLALEIIGGIILYLMAALQMSRHLVGHWCYNKWLAKKAAWELNKDSYYNTDPGEYRVGRYVDGDTQLGAAALSLFAMPIVLMLLIGYSRGTASQWIIAPKDVRTKVALKEAENKLKELEQELEVANA